MIQGQGLVFINSGGHFLPLIWDSKEAEIQRVTQFQFRRGLGWCVDPCVMVYTSRRWSARWQLGEVVTSAVEEGVRCRFSHPFRGRAGVWRLLACAATTAAYTLRAYKADICFWIKLSALEADINPPRCFKFIFSLEKNNLVFQCSLELFFLIVSLLNVFLLKCRPFFSEFKPTDSTLTCLNYLLQTPLN